jgi:hypothetical protein
MTRCSLVRRCCPILPAERSASLLYPNGDYYIGEYSVNLPHGVGRLFNSSHQLILDGHWQNGQHVISGVTPADGGSTREEPPIVREETVVYRPAFALQTHDDSAGVVSVAAASAEVDSLESSASVASVAGWSTNHDHGASHLPPLPVPLHLITPVGPAILASAATTGHMPSMQRIGNV